MDFGHWEALATGDSFLHRLDARAKLMVTGLYIVTVVSYNKYDVSALLPCCIYPIFLITAGGLPMGFLLKKLALLSPFILLVGIFNPWIDTEVKINFGGYAVTGGWLSFCSLLERFVLTLLAGFCLLALTGMNALSLSLHQFHLPKPFVVQMLFLYRYIGVLGEEAERLMRAHALRSGGRKNMKLKAFVPILGNWLLRSTDRAERVYQAMLCRGFEEQFPVVNARRFGLGDTLYVMVWSGLFWMFRFIDIPQTIGLALMKNSG